MSIASETLFESSRRVEINFVEWSLLMSGSAEKVFLL